MSDSQLFKFLFPNAPPHRRAQGDAPRGPEAEAHARTLEAVLDREVQPGLQSPSLVSSFQGSIDAILLAIPSSLVADARYVPGYKSLIGALRAGTRFVVVHNRSYRARIEPWFEEAGHAPDSVTYVPLPDHVRFTDWAEDAYVALHDTADDTAYLMEPWSFFRRADALIAEAVQEYTPLQAAQAPLVFQGGNCLIGDGFWLLGKDYFDDTVYLLESGDPPVEVPGGVATEDFVRQLFSEYVDAARQLVVLGTEERIPRRSTYGTRSGDEFFLDYGYEGSGTFQPIFHIDMFVTLIGRNPAGEFEALVGSPSLADRMLGTTSPYALHDVYDQLAAQLSSAGMKVYRNPLVHRLVYGQTVTLGELRERVAREPNETLEMSIGELADAGADDATEVKPRIWYHVTWNNCLVENSVAHGRHVYMPTYGHNHNSALQVIDEEMRRLWEGLGFNVHLLGDFDEFAWRQGVVHCLKKYLKRGD